MESNRTRQISPSNKTKEPPMTIKKPQCPARCDELARSRSRSAKTVLSSSLTRRDFLSRSAALSVSPFVFAASNYAKDTTMTTADTDAAVAAAPATRQATEDSSIRPFKYRASDAELDDLRRRIVATRFPEKETVADFSQGVPLATVQKLARYWG